MSGKQGIPKANRRSKAPTTKPPRAAKKGKMSPRLARANNGHLESMVKVGWGIARMLVEYNAWRAKHGEPPVKQIDEPRILQLIEARKKSQRKNTSTYQARRSADAGQGDIDAARKLKWSAERIRALERRNRRGEFEESDETSDTDSATEEPEQDYDEDYPGGLETISEEREPSPDNIKVAGLSLRTGAQSMTAIPTEQNEQSNVFNDSEAAVDGPKFNNGADIFARPREPLNGHSDPVSTFASSGFLDASNMYGGIGNNGMEGQRTNTANENGFAQFTPDFFGEATYYTTAGSAEFPGQAEFPGRYPLSYTPYTVHDEVQQAETEANNAYFALRMAQAGVEKANKTLADARMRQSATLPMGAFRHFD